jgi:hypothetical protein
MYFIATASAIVSDTVFLSGPDSIFVGWSRGPGTPPDIGSLIGGGFVGAEQIAAIGSQAVDQVGLYVFGTGHPQNLFDEIHIFRPGYDQTLSSASAVNFDDDFSGYTWWSWNGPDQLIGALTQYTAEFTYL